MANSLGPRPSFKPPFWERSQIVFTVDPQPIPPPDIGPIRIHALDRRSLSHVADAREAVACMYEVVARLLRDAVRGARSGPASHVRWETPLPGTAWVEASSVGRGGEMLHQVWEC